MKKLIFILGLSGFVAVSCGTSSRMGYTHYDDVYDSRPSYSQEKRKSSTYEDSPQYPSNQPSNYNSARSNTDRYIDDESVSGNYSNRLRRFYGGGNTGFDYYSPYYTGFNDGFSYGIGTGFGYSGFGNMGFSSWNPFYSSSFYFGWGRPTWSVGFNYWNRPFYDPFYSYNSWGWNNNYWMNPYNSWYSPWTWGGGYGHNNYYGGDRNYNSNRNIYYGPRSGNYSNSGYRNNSQNSGPRNQSGNLNISPKSSPSYNTTPNKNGNSRPNNNVGRNYPSNVPDRYRNNSVSPQQRSSPSPSRSNSGSNSGSQRSGGSMQRSNK